tara:strand:+ start:6646 stop:8004 length:1359 start_codon:yes stop_codon:yes gene_type:complete
MTSEVSLNQYGFSFQVKVLSLLLKDENFFQQIYDILDENYFDGGANQWLIKAIRDYFEKYGAVPTLEALKILINSITNDVLKASVVDNLRESYKHVGATDLPFVKEKILDFCKNQQIKLAILESADLLESGEYDIIREKINKAMIAGSDRDIGHEYLTMFEDRYSETARVVVETPWDVINEVMGGGLGGGELGVVVAPAGVGKTWLLSAIGASSLGAGKTVIHYTLELNESYVGLRYDSIFTGIATQNLKYQKDEVKQKVDSIEGELLIKYYPTKCASVHTLSSHIHRLRLLGMNVDLVIVDYADIMCDTTKYVREVRHQLGNIYEDLRGLAGQLQVPIWTASQANRSSLEEDIIEAQKVAESYQKVMTADFVFSMSRKVEDKIANTGRIHIIKNRFGPDGLTFPASVNTNNGKIMVYETGTLGGKEVQGKMNKKNEFVRKMLKNKYDDIMN